MKNFIIGFVLGSVLFGALAYAAVTRIYLVDGTEQGFGTTVSPMFITIQ